MIFYGLETLSDREYNKNVCDNKKKIQIEWHLFDLK